MLYFDCAATYRPYPEALQAYEEVTLSHFGNSNSTHGYGRDAARILEEARQDILSNMGLQKTHRLIFTSGASEANNLALKGVAFQYQNRGKKILLSAGEHASVIHPLQQLGQDFGFEIVTLPLNEEGVVTPEALAKEMDGNVILVSIMAVNNETGAISPLKELASIVHSFPKAFFHCDATQAIGKVDLPYASLDMLTFSGHKFGALKGSGALVYKSTMRFQPLIAAGSQEEGRRGGTVNVAGAKALAVALAKSFAERKANFAKEKELVEYLALRLKEIPEVVPNSPLGASPYVYNFSLSSHKASVVVEALSEKEIYVSSVSACNSKGEPSSYVLEAMGKSPRLFQNSIRVSLPPSSKKEEIDAFITTLKTILQETRPL